VLICHVNNGGLPIG